MKTPEEIRKKNKLYKRTHNKKNQYIKEIMDLDKSYSLDELCYRSTYQLEMLLHTKKAVKRKKEEKE